MAGNLNLNDRLDAAREASGGELDKTTESRIREDFNLEQQHSEEYVAFIDHQDEDSGIKREIIAHAKELADIQDEINEKLSDRLDDERKLVVRFIDNED